MKRLCEHRTYVLVLHSHGRWKMCHGHRLKHWLWYQAEAFSLSNPISRIVQHALQRASIIFMSLMLVQFNRKEKTQLEGLKPRINRVCVGQKQDLRGDYHVLATGLCTECQTIPNKCFPLSRLLGPKVAVVVEVGSQHPVHVTFFHTPTADW